MLTVELLDDRGYTLASIQATVDQVNSGEIDFAVDIEATAVGYCVKSATNKILITGPLNANRHLQPGATINLNIELYMGDNRVMFHEHGFIYNEDESDFVHRKNRATLLHTGIALEHRHLEL